jgi:hypothetical protein
VVVPFMYSIDQNAKTHWRSAGEARNTKRTHSRLSVPSLGWASCFKVSICHPPLHIGLQIEIELVLRGDGLA